MRITFQTGIIPYDSRAGGTTHLGSVRVEKDGTKVAIGATLTLDWSRDLGSDVNVYFPDLYQDDIIGAFGYLYQVIDLDHREDKDHKHDDSVVLKRLEGKEIPAGIDWTPKAFAIPLQTGSAHVAAKLHDVPIAIKSITVTAVNGKQMAVADVRISEDKSGRNNPLRVEVRAGDILTIGGERHRILNVVPRDEKRHITGWVELDPKKAPAAKSDR